MRYIIALVLIFVAVECFAYDYEIVNVGDTVIVKESGLRQYSY